MRFKISQCPYVVTTGNNKIKNERIKLPNKGATMITLPNLTPFVSTVKDIMNLNRLHIWTFSLYMDPKNNQGAVPSSMLPLHGPSVDPKDRD